MHITVHASDGTPDRVLFSHVVEAALLSLLPAVLMIWFLVPVTALVYALLCNMQLFFTCAFLIQNHQTPIDYTRLSCIFLDPTADQSQSASQWSYVVCRPCRHFFIHPDAV